MSHKNLSDRLAKSSGVVKRYVLHASVWYILSSFSIKLFLIGEFPVKYTLVTILKWNWDKSLLTWKLLHSISVSFYRLAKIMLSAC